MTNLLVVSRGNAAANVDSSQRQRVACNDRFCLRESVRMPWEVALAVGFDNDTQEEQITLDVFVAQCCILTRLCN